MNNPKNIIILCYANYCRSPVAEKILNSLSYNALLFKSYGINPMVSSNMDKRSETFLREKGVFDISHLPKKITTSTLDSSHLVLCMDHEVLMYMNQKYKKYSKKYKIFSFLKPSLRVEDPYKFDQEQYMFVMEKIYMISKAFKEEDFS